MIDRFINVRGLRLSAREWRTAAQGGTKPVLMLHGYLDHKASFDLLAPLLPPPLAPIAIDMRGHGDSDRVGPGGFYHLAEFVADTLLALRELGISRAPIIGHSLGGIVAKLAAAASPDLVERVVALEALGPLTAEADEAAERLGSYAAGLARVRTEARAHPSREAALARLHDAAPQLPPHALELMLDGGARRTEGGGYVFKHDPLLRVRSPHPYSEAHVLAMLGAIRCPVLLVYAEPNTAPLPREIIRARANAIAQREEHVIANVGHHLHLEVPQKVAAAIVPFLLR